MSELHKLTSLFTSIAQYEAQEVTSKLRGLVETDSNSFKTNMNEVANKAIEYMKSKVTLSKFASENESKLRAIITDPTCDTPICAGIVKLYNDCNPDIWSLFPNYKKFVCNNGQPVKFGQLGRFTTFPAGQTMAAFETANYNDLTTALENEYLLGCTIKTPKNINGAYSINVSREICGDSQALTVICMTINMLEVIQMHVDLGVKKAVIDYLILQANTITSSGTTLYDIFADMVAQSEAIAGGVESSNKVFFVNNPIIERMANEKQNGIKTFENLVLTCGNKFCQIYCWNGVSYFVVLPQNILPKTAGNLYQIILTKADQFFAGSSDIISAELPNDLARLLNNNKNKVVALENYLIEELPQVIGKTTFKLAIA